MAVGDRAITIRYDDVYHYYRPPRAHHCRVLNVVVMRFDHFCPWTGNTIGERNYRAFVSFLAFAFLALAHAAAFCTLHIVRHLRDADVGAAGRSSGGDGAAEVLVADGAGAAAPIGAPTEDDSTVEKLLEIVATPVLLIVIAGATPRAPRVCHSCESLVEPRRSTVGFSGRPSGRPPHTCGTTLCKSLWSAFAARATGWRPQVMRSCSNGLSLWLGDGSVGSEDISLCLSPVPCVCGPRCAPVPSVRFPLLCRPPCCVLWESMWGEVLLM